MGTSNHLRTMTTREETSHSSSNIVLNMNTSCTIIKVIFLVNRHNKTEMILLLSDVLGHNGVEVLLAEDDAVC